MKIFGKLRSRILSLLVLNESEQFYVREVALKINSSAMGALKELNKLETEGIVRSERKGRLRLFSINIDSPSYSELKGLVIKTFGLVDVVRKALSKIGGIESSFIFGSFARGANDYKSDVDLFIIGDADYKKISAEVSQLEKRLGREINVDLMTADEYRKRLEKRDPYILDIDRGEKIYLAVHEK